jgi:ligand-binding SRPBCC domain-containing protein
MKVSITSKIDASAEQAWALAKQSNTLLYVTRGLLGFKPIGSQLPHEWHQGKTQQLKIMLFGLIPAWCHDVHFIEISDSKMVMLTRESGGVVTTWNHLIRIESVGSSSCSYTDDVEIKAGLFTLIVWLYAHVFYRYRQLRWRKLIKSNATNV